jgi:hypothetical protein
MTADLTILEQSTLAERGRLQAFCSSLLALLGAGVAVVAFLGALVVGLPLMIAASLTYDPRRSGRRGWQELQPVEA